jgi:hypothetical protein
MDEQALYKDNYLIPIFRKKVSELSSLVAEMEATIIFQNNKIKELSDKLDYFESISKSDSDIVSGSVTRTKKKQPSSPDGGTF